MNKCDVRVSCSNFEFFMGSNRNKWKIKVVVIPHFVDEDSFGAFTNGHEKLHVENEDPHSYI